MSEHPWDLDVEIFTSSLMIFLSSKYLMNRSLEVQQILNTKVRRHIVNLDIYVLGRKPDIRVEKPRYREARLVTYLVVYFLTISTSISFAVQIILTRVARLVKSSVNTDAATLASTSIKLLNEGFLTCTSYSILTHLYSTRQTKKSQVALICLLYTSDAADE